MLGVIQEQHPDRCRLFAQWKGLDWPILHDPINVLQPRAVPLFVAIDESGVVVDTGLKPSELDGFLSRTADHAKAPVTVTRPEAKSLDRLAAETGESADWMAAADHRILWDGESALEAAISCYRKAIEAAPHSGAAHFGLGVALRMRYDSGRGGPQDFQLAVNSWDRALEADPNHYIYRRRIQQYGPRLSKPYPFYDWIQQARDEIIARGDQPVELSAEPVGAEIAQPATEMESRGDAVEPPDPSGRIRRDDEKLVRASAVVVPGTIRKGEAVRVHLKLQLGGHAHWNNQAEPLTVWIDVPEGWRAESLLLQAAQPDQPESDEVRTLDFELHSPRTATSGTIRGYALYYVCEEQGGQCLYRRQDILISVRFRQ